MKNFIKWPFRILRHIIGFILESIGTIILAIGSLIYAVGMYVKEPKLVSMLLREFIKNIKNLKK